MIRHDSHQPLWSEDSWFVRLGVIVLVLLWAAVMGFSMAELLTSPMPPIDPMYQPPLGSQLGRQ